MTPSDSPIIQPAVGSLPSPKEEAEHRKQAGRFDGIAIAVGAIGLLSLTFMLERLLSPFVVIVALYILLTPFREYRAARTMMWTAGVLFMFWFLVTLSSLLVPFILGLLLAYLFNPAVTLLERRYNRSRTLGAAVIVFTLFGLIAFAGYLIVPQLIDQSKSIVNKTISFVTANATQVDEAHIKQFLRSLGLPRRMVDQIVTSQVTPQIKAFLGEIPEWIVGLMKRVPMLVERTLNLIIIPISAFYFLRDWPKMANMFFQFFPPSVRPKRREMFDNIDNILYTYIRGQITVATIIGILAAITFSLLNIPYAGLLGLAVGILDLIPFIGLIFSVVIVELVIILTMQLNFGVVMSGVLVIVGLHALEAYALAPRIVGHGIGVPPILMILSLFIFGYFLGFVGMIIAVPATAVLLLFLEQYRRMQEEIVDPYASKPRPVTSPS